MREELDNLEVLPDHPPLVKLSPMYPWGISSDDGLPYYAGTPHVFELPRVRGLEDLCGHGARLGGDLIHWDGIEHFPTGPRFVAFDKKTNWSAAIDDTGLLRYGANPVPEMFGAPFEEQLDPSRVFTRVAVGEGFACALDTAGRLTCHAHPDDPRRAEIVSLFAGDRFLRVSASRFTVCAEREDDHRVVCNDGTELDWGPLRDLVVAYQGRWVETDMPWGWENVYVGWGEAPQLCAITERNAIRCVGSYYDVPWVQDALPAGW